MSKPGFDPAPRLGLSVSVLAATACLMLIVPQVVVALTSFDPSPAALFPPHDLSLRWYMNALARPAFRQALLLSLLIAFASTVISVSAGTMASLLIVRHRFIGRNLLATALQLPMMIPEVVLGLGLLILFARLHMYWSYRNILLAHAVITLPYAVRVITANLQTVSRSIEDAAYMLGAGPVRTFFSITLPVIKPGMMAAAAFCFVVSFDNFTVTAFLVTGRGTLPIEIYGYIRTESDPTVAAISTMLIVASIGGLLAIDRIIGLAGITRSGGIGR